MKELEEKERKAGQNWSWAKLKMTHQECLQALTITLDRQVAKRIPGARFIIDEQNKETIDQVVKYIIGSPEFKGEHHKGILLIGRFGTGKTTILSAVADLYLAITRRIIQVTSAVELTAQIRKGKAAVEDFCHKPLLIDEIGRETESVKDYGTEIRPVPDIIGIRYSRGSLTFATSNFIVHAHQANGGLSLEQKYGRYITDRMTEMFNVIVMTGESRRR